MTAATVADLLAREFREEYDDRTTLVDATEREYDYHWLCTSSWKAGNFLRHSGVRQGVTVGVVGDGPLALLAFFGTTLLEGTTYFEPPADLADTDDFRALVAPVRDLESGTYALPPGAQRVGYGAKPEEPDIHNFDAGIWSENPAFPPLSIEPETAILTNGERTVSHAEALEAARAVIDEYGIGQGERVVVRAPLSSLEAVVAGVIAPLLAEGVIVLTESAAETTVDRGDYAVAGGEPDASVPEPERIALEGVSVE
ncbi:hypothetical protein [Halopiger xanaduensis]|uniref:AMP-dependent synthetase and ligase n=1 Tax=Halopiger xanaduensis (strain DSM 18323 / JCM 14033 / SH-6) TaxID=797210 RepID=F8D5I0_HALXS|nr:hypothetical protein [Halopiger xanaduensis]AEH38816.1 hypothetical protein Halxa_4214 [Halopiger xanaduensis SH-6]